LVIGRAGTGGRAGDTEPISRRNAATTAPNSPSLLRGVLGSAAFPTGADGLLNGDSNSGAAANGGESTRADSLSRGDSVSSGSVGDSLSLLRRAALISLSEADS